MKYSTRILLLFTLLTTTLFSQYKTITLSNQYKQPVIDIIYADTISKKYPKIYFFSNITFKKNDDVTKIDHFTEIKVLSFSNQHLFLIKCYEKFSFSFVTDFKFKFIKYLEVPLFLQNQYSCYKKYDESSEKYNFFKYVLGSSFREITVKKDKLYINVQDWTGYQYGNKIYKFIYQLDSFRLLDFEQNIF